MSFLLRPLSTVVQIVTLFSITFLLNSEYDMNKYPSFYTLIIRFDRIFVKDFFHKNIDFFIFIYWRFLYRGKMSVKNHEILPRSCRDLAARQTVGTIEFFRGPRQDRQDPRSYIIYFFNIYTLIILYFTSLKI